MAEINFNKNPWDILGIEPTENKRLIKKAYAKMTQKYHPEDDPENFRLVHDAFEIIMASLDNEIGQKTFDINIKKVLIKDEKQCEESIDTEVQEVNSEEFIDQESEETIDFDFGDTFEKLDQNNTSNESFASSEETSVTINESISYEKIEELYINKIIEIIEYNSSINYIYPLFMEKQIIELLNNPEFYQKVIHEIQIRFHKIGAVSLRFLIDYFNDLEKYNDVEYDVRFCDLAQVFYEERKKRQAEELEAQQKTRLVVYLAGLSLLVFIAGLYIFSDYQQRIEEKENREKFEEISKNIEIETPNINDILTGKEKPKNSSDAVPQVQEDDEEVKTALANTSYTETDDVSILTTPSGKTFECDATWCYGYGRVIVLLKDNEYYGVDVLTDKEYGSFEKLDPYKEPNTELAHYYVVKKNGKYAIYSQAMEKLTDFSNDDMFTSPRSYSHCIINENGKFRFVKK